MNDARGQLSLLDFRPATTRREETKSDNAPAIATSRGPTLRPYQLDALAAIEREFATGRRSTLLVLPTGSGKTVVFAELARRNRGRTLVIAHRTELLEQARRKLLEVGVDAEIEQGPRYARSDAACVVASVQTLRGDRLLRFAPDAFALVVVDEVHHAISQGYRTVLERFGAALVLGVTATPDRGDGRALRGVLESVAYRYNLRDAIRDRWLVPLVARRVRLVGVDLSTVRTHHGDLDQGELARVLTEEKALHAICSPLVQLAGDRPTIVFGVDVAHAHKIADVINRHRPGRALAIDGSASSDDRAAALRAFANYEIQFLVNCLDQETEILSRRGWIGMESVCANEIVATIDPRSLRCVWHRVTKVVRRERGANERMVQIRNQTLDVRVTEGHRMLVGAGEDRHLVIAEAGDLPRRRGPYDLSVATFGTPLRRLPLTLDECRFVGLVITDGWIDRGRGCRGIVIAQSTRFDDSWREIERILTACEFDWRKYTRPGNTYAIPKGTAAWKLTRRGYGRLLPYLDKQMSPLLLDLDRDQARAFFEGLWLGDGVKERTRVRRGGVRRSWCIVNTDKILLDRIQALAVTRGFAANISPPRDNGPTATKPIYKIIIRDRHLVRTNNHTVATSGGNPAIFEDGWRNEPVWCVTTPTGTIVTRRRGKALVMGQCALYTEGTDLPNASCIALARPTMSRALMTQMCGRATRLYPGKEDALILDFVGNSKHALVGPEDALAGHDVPLEVRAAIAKVLEGARQVDLGTILADAEAKADAHRASVGLTVLATYRQHEIDPYLGRRPPPNGAWTGEPASEKQIAAMVKAGLSKPPPGITKGEASSILDAVSERRKRGLATPAQVRYLRKFKLETQYMTMTRATTLILQLKRHNHAPWSVRNEPEYIKGGIFRASSGETA